jgi:hypothetical protein
VRACGKKCRAFEAKQMGVKNLSFLEILMFLWVVMADQVLYMWMQVTIWMMSIHWRERDWSCLREAVRDEEPGGMGYFGSLWVVEVF